MKLISRKYHPGDEVYINKLYKLIINIDRSLPEYEWEWLNTWNGQGSIWLLFDEDRKENGQLIGQYSLTPTPFSIWGESYLAGKTENCMSHPDYRGAGIYFPHEKKYFQEAQKRFQLFFTTVGNVAKGAPGAVRDGEMAREIIENPCGIVVEPENIDGLYAAVKKLILSNEMRKYVSTASGNLALKYTRKDQTAKFISLLEDTLINPRCIKE